MVVTKTSIILGVPQWSVRRSARYLFPSDSFGIHPGRSSTLERNFKERIVKLNVEFSVMVFADLVLKLVGI